MTRRSGRTLAAVLAALLLVGTPLTAAARKREKNEFTVVVDGKTIKLPKNVTFQAGSPSIPFMALGQARRGKRQRTGSVACADFPPATIPGTSTFCTAQYQDWKLGRHPVLDTWSSSGVHLSVTFTSYDGTTVEGSFSFPSLPSITGKPSISFEGHFRGRLLGH